jgi:hypothetical protein
MRDLLHDFDFTLHRYSLRMNPQTLAAAVVEASRSALRRDACGSAAQSLPEPSSAPRRANREPAFHCSLTVEGGFR